MFGQLPICSLIPRCPRLIVVLTFLETAGRLKLLEEAAAEPWGHQPFMKSGLLRNGLFYCDRSDCSRTATSSQLVPNGRVLKRGSWSGFKPPSGIQQLAFELNLLVILKTTRNSTTRLSRYSILGASCSAREMDNTKYAFGAIPEEQGHGNAYPVT